MKKILLLIALVVGTSGSLVRPLQAATSQRTSQRLVPTSECVNAIIGEVGNQPFETQVKLAAAIRNRLAHGMGLTGVYGVNNPVVKQATARVRARALRAWRQSASFHLPAAIRFFGCDADRPALPAYGLTPVFKSGAITFYQ